MRASEVGRGHFLFKSYETRFFKLCKKMKLFIFCRQAIDSMLSLCYNFMNAFCMSITDAVDVPDDYVG